MLTLLYITNYTETLCILPNRLMQRYSSEFVFGRYIISTLNQVAGYAVFGCVKVFLSISRRTPSLYTVATSSAMTIYIISRYITAIEILL